MKIGEIVRRYREEHDLSMRQFAKMSGLSHAYIPLIERGRNHNGAPLVPSITVYKQLADAMGITLHDLMKMVDDDECVDLSVEANAVAPDTANNDFPLTEHEKRLVEAYRANPSMQGAVDKLLEIEGIGSDTEELEALFSSMEEKKSVPV